MARGKISGERGRGLAVRSPFQTQQYPRP